MGCLKGLKRVSEGEDWMIDWVDGRRVDEEKTRERLVERLFLKRNDRCLWKEVNLKMEQNEIA